MLANFIRDFIDLVIKKYENRKKLINKKLYETPSPADLIGPTPSIPEKVQLFIPLLYRTLYSEQMFTCLHETKTVKKAFLADIEIGSTPASAPHQLTQQ
jgi:hypothetical protein